MDSSRYIYNDHHQILGVQQLYNVIGLKVLGLNTTEVHILLIHSTKRWHLVFYTFFREGLAMLKVAPEIRKKRGAKNLY